MEAQRLLGVNLWKHVAGREVQTHQSPAVMVTAAGRLYPSRHFQLQKYVDLMASPERSSVKESGD